MSAFPDPFWGEVPQERLVSLACLVNRCYWLGMKLDLGWLIQLVTPPVAHTCWKQAISFGFNPPILHGITYISCLNQHAFPKFAKFLLDSPKGWLNALWVPFFHVSPIFPGEPLFGSQKVQCVLIVCTCFMRIMDWFLRENGKTGHHSDIPIRYGVENRTPFRFSH